MRRMKQIYVYSQYKQDPPEQIITDGLFNTKAQQFKDSVKVTGCVLLSFLLFGITFDWIRRVRTRAPIEGQGERLHGPLSN